MPKFSQTSQERLATCHPDLQAVCKELIKQYDFAVLCGYRGEKDQNDAYKKGTSGVCYPHSAHNKTPSFAVDIVPYPLDWNDLARFKEMIVRFDTVANMLRAKGIIEHKFVYGGYWPKWQDWPHIEIEEE